MMTRFRSRNVLWLAVVLGAGFVAMQFVRPRLSNPPVTADLQAPAEVKAILKTSCYNCHSNETKLSWFAEPVPAIWLVASDVREARAHLNFSELGKLPAGQQKGFLFEAVSQIELGAMPLPQYEWLHPESGVTAEQLAALKTYLVALSPEKIATQEEIKSADEEYAKWVAGGDARTAEVSPAPNGLTFLPGYKNWRAISSTERFDNYTMRQILGNDVAVQAIAESRLDPWPDGTAFAKVAWLEQADENGAIKPGKFFQVEFMVRDSRKYAATLGWGFGRWRGTDLKPYGKDATFAKECVGCHRPLTKTNYVFTMTILV